MWKFSIILCLIGILLASYLFYNYLFPGHAGLCYVNSQVNCQAVTQGTLSTFVGIPISLVGLVGYIIILYAALIKSKKLYLFMSAFGTVFCLRITILELLVVKIICPVCLACQLDMLILFIISLKLLRKPLPQTN